MGYIQLKIPEITAMDSTPEPVPDAAEKPIRRFTPLWVLCLIGRHAWTIELPIRLCRRCNQTERENRNTQGDSWWALENFNPVMRRWRRVFLIIALMVGLVTLGFLVVQMLENPEPAPSQIINSPIIAFSKFLWTPRESQQLQGPGPNYFSRENIYLDEQGHLHLKVDWVDGEWRSAELISTRSLGYGKYSIKLGHLPGPLIDAVTLGFLTWDNSPEEFHREIDIELRHRIVDGKATSGSFTVQPWETAGNVIRLGEKLGNRFSFDWGPDRIIFEAQDVDDNVIDSWTYSAEVPTPGNEKIRINLWLAGGNPPADEQPIEVVIEEFSFQPKVAN